VFIGRYLVPNEYRNTTKAKKIAGAMANQRSVFTGWGSGGDCGGSYGFIGHYSGFGSRGLILTRFRDRFVCSAILGNQRLAR